MHHNATSTTKARTKSTKPHTTSKPMTTTKRSKGNFSGASFGGGIVVGVAASVVIILILYFLKFRKNDNEYDKVSILAGILENKLRRIHPIHNARFDQIEQAKAYFRSH